MNGFPPTSIDQVIAGMAEAAAGVHADRAPHLAERVGVQRAPLPNGVRRAVLIRDRFTCQWCQAHPRDHRRIVLEIDHIVPWSAGGADHPVNLRTLCEPCNQERSNRVTGRERRALPIAHRCRRCSTDDLIYVPFLTGFCTECVDVGAVPYRADLILGGPIPAVGVPSADEPDPEIAYRPVVGQTIQVLRDRAAALTVACPWCDAEPGQPCAGITRAAAHPSRIEAL